MAGFKGSIVIRNWSGAKEWEKFFNYAPEVALNITVRRDLVRQYDVEVLPMQAGPAVIKSKNALLSADEDWTEVCITLLEEKQVLLPLPDTRYRTRQLQKRIVSNDSFISINSNKYSDNKSRQDNEGI